MNLRSLVFIVVAALGLLGSFFYEYPEIGIDCLVVTGALSVLWRIGAVTAATIQDLSPIVKRAHTTAYVLFGLLFSASLVEGVFFDDGIDLKSHLFAFGACLVASHSSLYEYARKGACINRNDR